MNALTAVKPAALGALMGLYAGLACIAFFLVLYGINSTYLISPVVLTGFVVIVIFKILTSYRLWKAQRGQVPFKSALQSVFLVSVVSLLLVFLFLYLMFNVADKTLVEQARKNISENMMKSFDAGKITKLQLDAGLSKVNDFKLGLGMFWGMYSVTLFVGFFYAVVFAAISRLIGRDISLPPLSPN